MGRKKFTEDECLDALSKASDMTEGKLSQTKYQQLNISPSATVIQERCGGWNKAKEKIGLETFRSNEIDEPPKIFDISEDEWKEMSKHLRFRRRRQAFVAKKKIEVGCQKCGYNKYPSALDYHHMDSENKFRDISTMVTQGYSTERIREEMKKCRVLCSNCHEEITHGDIYSISEA